MSTAPFFRQELRRLAKAVEAGQCCNTNYERAYDRHSYLCPTAKMVCLVVCLVPALGGNGQKPKYMGCNVPP